RCELVVSELIVSELIVAKLIVPKLIVGGGRVVTSVCEIVTGNPPSMTGHCVVVTEIMRSVTSKCCMRVRPAVGARCTATPPLTHVGQGRRGPPRLRNPSPHLRRENPPATPPPP